MVLTCSFCGREPDIGSNCCALFWAAQWHLNHAQYQQERAAYQAQIDAEADEYTSIDWSVG